MASLTGYLNPLARFSDKQLRTADDETRRELAKAVPMVTVGANQAATANLRLEHASELSGAVLYDDGSPAVGLEMQLLRKEKDGRLSPPPPGAVNGMGLFEGTDDRGRYQVIGVPQGEYTLRVILPTQRISLGGLLHGGTSMTLVAGQGEGLSIYLGDTFRKKDARVVKIGEGEQSGGLDITIASDGLHDVGGTLVAKRDDHPLNRGHVELLYADDREVARSVDIKDEDGYFEFAYVPAGQHILRLSGAFDAEQVQGRQGSMSFTEDRVIHKYGGTELPIVVQGDVSGLELAAPDVAADKASSP